MKPVPDRTFDPVDDLTHHVPGRKDVSKPSKSAAAARLLQLLLYGEASEATPVKDTTTVEVDSAIDWDLVPDDLAEVNARDTKWLSETTIKDAAYEGGNNNIAPIADASPKLCSSSQFATAVYPTSASDTLVPDLGETWDDVARRELEHLYLQERLHEKERCERRRRAFHEWLNKVMAHHRRLVSHGAPFNF